VARKYAFNPPKIRFHSTWLEKLFYTFLTLELKLITRFCHPQMKKHLRGCRPTHRMQQSSPHSVSRHHRLITVAALAPRESPAWAARILPLQDGAQILARW
jgi:hypothetical protein